MFIDLEFPALFCKVIVQVVLGNPLFLPKVMLFKPDMLILLLKMVVVSKEVSLDANESPLNITMVWELIFTPHAASSLPLMAKFCAVLKELTVKVTELSSSLA